MSNNDKKAFDASYTTSPTFFPDELRIVGGADLPDKRERGPIDTSASAVWKTVDGADVLWDKHPLYNKHRLAQPLKPGLIQSIDFLGVIHGPLIVKIDGQPTVNAGASRTRAARVVNFLRKQQCGVAGKRDSEAAPVCIAKSLPLIKLEVHHKRSVGGTADLIGRRGGENHARQDEPLAATIEDAARLLDETKDLEAVARVYCVDSQTVRLWMKFYDVACPETLAAVKDGRLAITAAAVLAREEDHIRQKELLEKLLAGEFRPTVRRALRIVRKDGGKGGNPFQGKAALVKFSSHVKESAGKGAFWEGVAALLELQTTGKTKDERLRKVFKEYDGDK